MKGSSLLLFTAILLLPILIDGRSDCPNPTVKKRTIIRSKESMKNGALLLSKEIVGSAHDCYNLCCTFDTCTTAVMHYKPTVNELGEDQVEKLCYLFACGNPSVCEFGEHLRYAVIELPRVLPQRKIQLC